MQPGTFVPAPEPAPSASPAKQRGGNGPPSKHRGAPRAPSTRRRATARRAGEGSGRPALHSPAPALPRPRPGRGQKVSSQSPRYPLAQPTAEHNCLVAPESGPRRLAAAPGPSVAPPSARAGLPSFTYHRAGRRAAAGRAAAVAVVASGAAAGVRPRGEKRRKVVLCRLRDTAGPAPGSAPSPTLPPARSLAHPPAPQAPAP